MTRLCGDAPFATLDRETQRGIQGDGCCHEQGSTYHVIAALRVWDAEHDTHVASVSRSQWIFVPMVREIVKKSRTSGRYPPMRVGMSGASSRGRMNPAALHSVTDTTSHLRDESAYPAFGALRNSRWFCGLSVSALAQLARSASIRSFSARQQIVLDGRWLGAAALLVRGCICAVRKTDGSRELTLEAFLAGDMLVDALVDPDNALSSDSLVAAETSVLLLIPREEFLAVARAIPEVALALARELERRLRGIKALAWGLATTDVESRLYRLLLNLARDQGEVGAEGTVIARFPTQRELAGRIGACRETVSRIVADLARQGLLTLQGRRLTLMPRFFAMARAAEGF